LKQRRRSSYLRFVWATVSLLAAAAIPAHTETGLDAGVLSGMGPNGMAAICLRKKSFVRATTNTELL